jgi:FAD-linked oxidoreductase
MKTSRDGRSGLWKNWWRHQSCRPIAYFEPGSVDQLVAIVRKSRGPGAAVKVIGGGHSLSTIACTQGSMISLDRLNGVVDIDTAGRTITVEAGLRLYELNEILARVGLALPTLGSIAEQSVAGAISTGTHGIRSRTGLLATMVMGLELVTATGEILTLSRDENEELFLAALVGLGALGIISKVTLRCGAEFSLHEVMEWMSAESILGRLDSLIETNEYCRVFWTPGEKLALLQCANRAEPATGPRARAPLMTAVKDMSWLLRKGRVGARRERTDRSDRILCNPRWFTRTVGVLNYASDFVKGVFLNSEYGIDQDRAVEALRELHRLGRQGLRFYAPLELRFCTGDDAWLSPAHGRDTCFVGFNGWAGRANPEFLGAFRQYEAVMKRFDGRPHWGKTHFYAHEDLRRTYPRWEDFRAMRARIDPDDLFVNDYLRETLAIGRQTHGLEGEVRPMGGRDRSVVGDWLRVRDGAGQTRSEGRPGGAAP